MRGHFRHRGVVALTLAAVTTLAALALLSSSTPSLHTLPQQAQLLRRRLSRVSVPTDPDFHWDGSTSDLAQQFYVRHSAGATAEPLNYDDDALPASVRARLTRRKLSFRALPPLLQRAVVWDSGFAFSPAPQSKFTRIYTVNGVSMARIGVSMADYLSSGCNTSNCTDPNGVATFRSKTCSGSMMLSVSHCASEDVTDGLPHMSMWATGGDPSAIPTMNIERHSWDDKVYLEKYLVFAVHTTADENEPPWDNCPSPGVYGSTIIPCDQYTPARAAAMNWTDPAPSALVDAWLDQFRDDTRRSPLIVGLPLGGGLVLAGLLGYGYVRVRRRRRQYVRGASSGAGDAKSGGALGASTLDQGLLTPRAKDPYMVATDSLAAYRGAAVRQFSTHHLLTTLLNDPTLRTRRLNYAKLEFERELATGAFGEVWQCAYDGAVVAVKRLLQTRKRTSEDVHTFIDEIQLTASLEHANILQVVGVAWNTLENLCMVMEYLAQGDLQGHLRRHGDRMSWSRDKLPLATGVARALQYLHLRSPPLIHRDVKARNVLLTERLDAKLIDFGVSRSYGDCCMTVGVGTPYWTAPEVLEGTVYSEKSDIYSFGVLLSELDTCTAPYHDAKTEGQCEPLQPFRILKLVMAGALKPNFTDACPSQVRVVADLCLRRDPAQRPSATDVVALLEALADTRESF